MNKEDIINHDAKFIFYQEALIKSFTHAMEEAVDEEDYHHAAQLRGKIKQIKQVKP